MPKGDMRKGTLRRKPEQLGDILHKILKKMDIPHKRTDRHLVELWRRAVGDQIAERTLPENVKRGSLHVLVSSPAWLHQLQFLKEEILLKLNELSGKEDFRRLHFSIGEIPGNPASLPTKESPPFSPEGLRERDRKMMEESLTAIGDVELREAVRRAMLAEIIRRREIQKKKGF